MIALIDCDNFYASAETLFRPDLRDKPIIVGSSNDGCVIARSKQSKALGVKMGCPIFEIRDLIKQHDIQVFSSNFALYGSISDRVMATIESIVPRVERYSIDECFADIGRMAHIDNIESFGRQIKETVHKHTGISVSAGISSTKTLAKIAVHGAKNYPGTKGVVDLSDPERQKRLLRLVCVGDCWGVGKKGRERLEHLGIKTAYDLANMSTVKAQRLFSIVLVKTIEELNGQPRFEFEENPEQRKQMLCSRSFAERITNFNQMREIICEFAARAGAKLRGEHLLGRTVTVFIRTSFFSDDPRYTNSGTIRLGYPSNNSRIIMDAATTILEKIWKDGYRFAKAGIMLNEVFAEECLQYDLFATPASAARDEKLMTVIDQINHKSKGKVWFGSQRSEQDWFVRRSHLSPRYTTRWEDLPVVK